MRSFNFNHLFCHSQLEVVSVKELFIQIQHCLLIYYQMFVCVLLKCEFKRQILYTNSQSHQQSKYSKTEKKLNCTIPTIIIIYLRKNLENQLLPKGIPHSHISTSKMKIILLLENILRAISLRHRNLCVKCKGHFFKSI